MTWPEVALAGQEQRHELVLQGKVVQERVEKDGLDENIFKLDKLNFLQISQAKLSILPDTLGSLKNLTSLVLKGNNLEAIPTTLNSLTKLKLLDLSLNKISSIPPIPSLTELTTLNLSLNVFSGVFHVEGVQNCQKLSLVDLSANTLTSLGNLQEHKLEHLAEVVSKQNKLESLSHEILENWPVIKKLDLSQNCLTAVPGQLGEICKLKELSLVENPLADNRLRKMCSQKGTKSVLDYVKNNCTKVGGGEKQEKGKGKKNKKGRKDSVEVDELCDILTVASLKDDMPEIVATESVKEVSLEILSGIIIMLSILPGQTLHCLLFHHWSRPGGGETEEVSQSSDQVRVIQCHFLFLCKFLGFIRLSVTIVIWPPLPHMTCPRCRAPSFTPPSSPRN